jgi:hypothetical protein
MKSAHISQKQELEVVGTKANTDSALQRGVAGPDFWSCHGQTAKFLPGPVRLTEAFAIHIAIHISVVYDVLPMTCSAVRALPCR